MRRSIPNPRGMALVMAMIVVVLITLLVAGAISFTGTELAASEAQTQEDGMSACVQAARNLFLTKLRAANPERLTDPTDPSMELLNISFDEDLRIQVAPNEVRGALLKSGHIGQVASISARKVTALEDKMAAVQDITDVTGGSNPPQFYAVSAVCREDSQNLASPEREIEFMVRVGL